MIRNLKANDLKVEDILRSADLDTPLFYLRKDNKTLSVAKRDPNDYYGTVWEDVLDTTSIRCKLDNQMREEVISFLVNSILVIDDDKYINTCKMGLGLPTALYGIVADDFLSILLGSVVTADSIVDSFNNVQMTEKIKDMAWCANKHLLIDHYINQEKLLENLSDPARDAIFKNYFDQKYHYNLNNFDQVPTRDRQCIKKYINKQTKKSRR